MSDPTPAAPHGETGGTSRTAHRGTTRARRRPGDRPRVLTGAGALDAAALALLLGAVVVGFGPVWGTTGYLVPAVGGAVLGLLVAWVGGWRRWSLLLVAPVTVLAYFLVGGPLVLPGTTVAGVLPSGETVQTLATDAVHGWKEFVTTVPPLASFPELGVVPFLLMLLTGVTAGTIAWRARHAAWALVPVLVALVGVILLGTVVPALPVVQGLVIAVVGLLWASWRASEARMGANRLLSEASRSATVRLRWHRARGGAAMLALGAVAAAFVAPHTLPDPQRLVLREVVVPPLDLHQYVSPLVGFRKYTKDEADTELFTVDGLPEGARVRLATMDSYAGVVYDVSSGAGGGVFNRAGETIDTVARGTTADVTVTVSGYRGVWVPDVGALAGIDWQGPRAQELGASTYYNDVSGTGIATAGLRPGDAYTLRSVVNPAPSEEDLATARLLEVDLPGQKDVPDLVPAKSQQFAAEETDPLERLLSIRTALTAGGVYSSGLDNQAPSRPGHSAERIDTLLAKDTMVGDDEQFAVALALLARQAGIPARVVMGFYPDAGTWQSGTPYVVTGKDVHAWVEVPFEGYGWVPFDAIPDEDNKVEPQPKSDQVPKPPVLEDPEPPEEPPAAEPGEVQDEDKDDADAGGVDWGVVALVVLAVVVPLALLLLPVLLLLAYKARRRGRRRSATDPVDRVSGGWREVVDVATDLGAGLPRGATRREGAQLLAAQLPAAATPTTTALAHRADATVFGGGQVTTAEADAYWQGVDTLVGELQAGVPARRRLRARLSLRSVRGADAPPLRTALAGAVRRTAASVWRPVVAAGRSLGGRMARATGRRGRRGDRKGRR